MDSREEVSKLVSATVLVPIRSISVEAIKLEPLFSPAAGSSVTKLGSSPSEIAFRIALISSFFSGKSATSTEILPDSFPITISPGKSASPALISFKLPFLSITIFCLVFSDVLEAMTSIPKSIYQEHRFAMQPLILSMIFIT